MATPAQIQRQFQRELQAHQEGKTRLQEATRRAEAMTYASSSVYGNKLVGQGLNLVTDAIEAKRSKIASGSTGEFAAHVRLLEGVPSSTLALITLKITIDTVFAPGQKVPRHATACAAYGEVVRNIGAKVFDECLLRQFAEAEPEAYGRTHLHRSKGYSYRVAKYRATMRRISHEAIKWPTNHRHKVGAWLLDRLCEATGWFASRLVTTSARKSINVLSAAPEVVRSIEAILVAAEALSACQWPMLCEPNDWSPDLSATPGGYLTSEVRTAIRLIRGINQEKLSQSFPSGPLKGEGETAPHLEAGEERGERGDPSEIALLPGELLLETASPAIVPISPGDHSEHVPSSKGHPPSPGSYDLRVPLQFINTIQKVPFQINQAVLRVALGCQESRLSIGSFRNADPLPLPHKPDPWESATPEEQKAYKMGRVRIEEENSLLAQRNYQTTETLHIAKMYAPEEVFYFPWFFDFRGRVYPQSNHLTPQGTDFARSLLVSAYSGPADREWLAFQVATTWGLGKETMQERQDWVNASLSMIQAVAQDPMGTISTWQGADEPWQFLAACFEFYACFISCERSWSNLLVGFDATCSGLQHLAALTRDRGAAELVNVAPTDRPADAYKTVAEAAKKYLPEEVRPLITRKVTKRVVMCLPYGLTQSSAKDYLRQALPKGFGVPIKDLVNAVYIKAIPEVLPGPMRARAWIQRVVNQVADETGKPVAFTSPSGFPVILDKRVFPTEQVDTKLLGRRIRITVSDFDAKDAPLNQRKITIGSVPNLIHSFDAALFHRAFEAWDRPIALVHDCISTLSCDVGWTMAHIRETFATMYEEDQLGLWADQLGVPVDPEVMIGTLDPAEIRQAPYLFC